MADQDHDFVDLKREVVEARHQAIKTDNQIRNLSLDIKSFEHRFAVLERRTRVASLGVNIIVAAVVAISAYLAHTVRTRMLVSDAEEERAAATRTRQEADAHLRDLRQRVDTLEQAAKKRREAEATLIELVDALHARNDKRAAELLETLDMRSVGTAASHLASAQVDDLRRRTADSSYRAGRNHVTAGRLEQAVTELRRALRLDPEGRSAAQARYLLATSLAGLGRFDEAIPVLRDLAKMDTDRVLSDETRYLLGAVLAHAGDKDEARKLLEQTAGAASRFAGAARAYLAAFDSGGELPTVAGKIPARTTVSRTSSSAAAAAGSAAPPARSSSSKQATAREGASKTTAGVQAESRQVEGKQPPSKQSQAKQTAAKPAPAKHAPARDTSPESVPATP